MLKFILNLSLWFKQFMSKANEINFWWNCNLILRMFTLTWWTVTRFPPWMSILGNYFIKSNAFSQNILLSKTMFILLHLLLKEKKNARIWAKVNATIAKEYGHIASNYGKKFCIYYKQHGRIIHKSSNPQDQWFSS